VSLIETGPGNLDGAADKRPLSPARGIVIGIVVGAAMWAGVWAFAAAVETWARWAGY